MSTTSNRITLDLPAAWQHPQEGIDFICKEAGELTYMPHSEYQQTCKRIRPLLRSAFAQNAAKCDGTNRESMNRLKDAAEVLKENREEIHRHTVPFITAMNKPGKLPTCSLKSEKEIPEEFPNRGTCRLTPKAARDSKRQQNKIAINKKTLDGLAKEISNKKDLFASEYTEHGCRQRAQLLVEMLVMSGVPRKSIQIQYICIPDEHSKTGWKVHAAPVIKLDFGMKYVIDPALSDHAISLGTWIKKQKKSDATSLILQDKGLLTLSTGHELTFDYNARDAITLFTTDANTELTFIDEENGKILLTQVDANKCKAYMKTLANHRLLLEENALKVSMPVSFRDDTKG